jgi:hypothetical protein
MHEKQFNLILERLDILVRFAERYEKKQEQLAKDNGTYDCEQNIGEHVKKNDESLQRNDNNESGEKNSESKSGDIEQRQIDQKATRVIKKFRRVIKRRRKKQTSVIAKVLSVFACEAHAYRLQIAPLRVFRRKKKYKWDDGG